MSGLSETEVKQEVKTILEGADLSTLSERKIRELLAEKFGDAVYTNPTKLLIAGEVEDFLNSLSPREDGEDPGEEQIPSSQVPLGQVLGKRKAEGEAGPQRPAKAAPKAGEATFDLSNRRQVTVRAFRGTPLVDIREFYEKDGNLAPGKKGIALNAEQWSAVKTHAALVSEALQAGTEDFSFKLSAQRKLHVRRMGKNLSVDIREFYKKDGEDAPGKKGINLQADQWEALVSATADIDAELQALGASASPKPQATTKGKEGSETAPEAAGPSEGAGSAAQRSSALPIVLSSNRRADISVFKGSTYVNIREYYEKNGEMLPGSKGIALSPEQFRILKSAAEIVSTALATEDLDFKVALSSRRALRINKFKTSVMVDIREMYEKDGKELPGKKGISLVADQWDSLVKGLPALEAALP